MKYLAFAALAACGQPGASDVDGNPGSDAPIAIDAALDAPGQVGTSSVSIIVEPNGNHGSELVTAIAGATKSVYMTMYEIDDSDVLNALVARKKAGLDVQVILDARRTSRSTRRRSRSSRRRAIAVVWSSVDVHVHAREDDHHRRRDRVDHDDEREQLVAIENREYLAIDTDAADVAEAIAVFQADHAHQAITPSGALVVADTNARQKLVELIDTATTTLDVEGEEFSDTNSNGVVDAVDAAAHRGVTVHVRRRERSTRPDRGDRASRTPAAPSSMTGPTSGNGTASNPYIHAKAIVVDCRHDLHARLRRLRELLRRLARLQPRARRDLRRRGRAREGQDGDRHGLRQGQGAVVTRRP